MNVEEIINYSKVATIEELKTIISKKMIDSTFGSIYCKNQTFNGFYRARQHNCFNGNKRENQYDVFVNENEFWNPPKDKVKLNGRCNRANETIFYASTSFETAITEIRPKVGNFITVCRFEPYTLEGKLPSFRIKPVAIRYLQKIEGVKSCVQKHNPNDFKELDEFFDILITAKVNDDNNYHYKITNAITECMLTDLINEEGDKFSMNGMIYPSVSDNYNGMNLILKPIYSLNFGIKSIQTFYVEQQLKNEKFELIHIRDGFIDFAKEHPSIKFDIEWKDNLVGNKTLV